MIDKIIPAALRLWLLFLFSFLFLGYSVIPSVVFGGIGGLASGIISAWWQTKGGIPQPTTAPPALKKISGKLRPPQVRHRIPFLKLFTRRDRRYTGSRRS